MPDKKILLGHGSGGKLMHDLIKNLLLEKLNNPILKELSDSAFINYREKLAFTTDSFVVSPLWFAGGDIGKLAVCGTVNDLVMAGANPEYLSLALIIEEGLDYRILEKIIDSISVNAKKTGIHIVTGDLKVVEKGACDKIFINTSGIGRVTVGRKLSVKNIRPQDKIIITGDIGNHGLAVLAKRKELDLGFNIRSDCAGLNNLIIPVLNKTSSIQFMRDPTRGGLATTLNEIAENSGFGVIIEEKNIPVSTKVKTACELLGIDPLYVANEGRAVIIVRANDAVKVLNLLKRHPLGKNAKIIGSVVNPVRGRLPKAAVGHLWCPASNGVKQPRGQVILNTILGTERIVDMLTSEPLPRIC